MILVVLVSLITLALGVLIISSVSSDSQSQLSEVRCEIIKAIHSWERDVCVTGNRGVIVCLSVSCYECGIHISSQTLRSWCERMLISALWWMSVSLLYEYEQEVVDVLISMSDKQNIFTALISLHDTVSLHLLLQSTTPSSTTTRYLLVACSVINRALLFCYSFVLLKLLCMICSESPHVFFHEQ